MPPGALSAQAIYEKEAKTRKIVTFCQELDAALGGGIATGQVTELCKLDLTVSDVVPLPCLRLCRLSLVMLRRWPAGHWKDAAGVRWFDSVQAQQDSRSPMQCSALHSLLCGSLARLVCGRCSKLDITSA